MEKAGDRKYRSLERIKSHWEGILGLDDRLQAENNSGMTLRSLEWATEWMTVTFIEMGNMKVGEAGFSGKIMTSVALI